MHPSLRFAPLCFLALAVGCGGSAPPATLPAPPPAPLSRGAFNQSALRLDLPLFWVADEDGDGAPSPHEVRTLLFYPSAPVWVRDGEFTEAYAQALEAIRAEANRPPPSDPRLRAVHRELSNAIPTLIETDLSALPEAHRAFAIRMLEVAELIDALYARQIGMSTLADQVPQEPMSRALFRRNWGPRCLGADTEELEVCSAIPGAPRQPVDVYPVDWQAASDFCETLEAREDAEVLLSPFAVVREREGESFALPYSAAYTRHARGIAEALRRAASALPTDEEAALIAYIEAAANAFETNDWHAADEAWAAMGGAGSRWYLRVGPDEVYWEPCGHKAGFHLTLALIDPGSVEWQSRLAPHMAAMEQALGPLSEGAYAPREVAFHLPDFIRVAINAGDDRNAFGATIGQSLPNWGPVAEEGRGRTVVMTNLYTDADSLGARRARAATLLGPRTLERYADDPTPGLLSTILHEATHNLGPAQEYRFEGRTDADVFGGGLASMLEELKAQTGALFYIDWLRERGVIDDALAERTYVDAFVWALGHISRGMTTADGRRKAYSQLAAIQVGFLMDRGALRFDPDGLAADGEHRGAFELELEAVPAAARALMAEVVRIKASLDLDAANALADRYVEGDVVPMQLIAERHRGFGQTTFVYAISGR